MAILMTAASGFGVAPAAIAHTPPSPDTNCNPESLHDFNAASTGTVTTGFTDEFGRAVAFLVDGALLPCGSEDFCPSGEDFLVVGLDPSASEDDIIIACNDILIGGTQVPIGDGELEFGLGGVFLPDSHHDPLTNGYYVKAHFWDGGFIFGSDADGDGDVEEGSGDCFESQSVSGSYATACPAGADNGWWFFTKCNATALPDWTFTTNGTLLRGFGDDDEDGIPNFAEDDDSDGIPNGAEDTDGDGFPDMINGNWNPTVTPGAIPPHASASCLISGHVDSPKSVDIGDGPGDVEIPSMTPPHLANEQCWGNGPNSGAYIVLTGEGDGSSFRFSVDARLCHAPTNESVGEPIITTSDGYKPTWVSGGHDSYTIYNQDHAERQITLCFAMVGGPPPCRTWHQWN